MSIVRALEGTVQASSMDVLVEGLLVDPFVDTGPTFGALEVAFSLLKVVLGCRRCCVDLCLEDVADGLDPGELLGWLWCLRARVGQAWSAWRCRSSSCCAVSP